MKNLAAQQLFDIFISTFNVDHYILINREQSDFNVFFYLTKLFSKKNLSADSDATLSIIQGLKI